VDQGFGPSDFTERRVSTGHLTARIGNRLAVPVCKRYRQSVRMSMLRLGDPGWYPIIYRPDELVFEDQL
jgi:hypothetical protein